MRRSRQLACRFIFIFCLLVHASSSHAWRSVLYPADWSAPDNVLRFETNKMIQDFSYAGFRAGTEPLPEIGGPIFDVTAAPFLADKTGKTNVTAAIQTAIDAAQASGGGVVWLPAGVYAVSPQGPNTYALRINSSNIVLRGAGTTETFVLNTATNMRGKSILLINGPSGAGFYATGNPPVPLSRDLLGPTTMIPMASTAGFAAGQWITLRADATDDWVTEHSETSWLGYANSLRGIAYFRQIIAVDHKNSTLTLNVPTRYYLKTRDNARVTRLNSGPITGTGLENFSIGNVQHAGIGWNESDYTIPGTAGHDVHDSFAIRLVRARDSWIRNVSTFQPPGNTATCHLLSNGILINDCTQVTLTNCHLQRSQYGGGGGNGYMFRLSNSSEILLQDCRATFTRHGFVLSQMAATGNVFNRCIDKDTGHQTGLTGSQATSGRNSDHHMHFSHANLIDACTGDSSVWEARYRPYGSAPLHNLTAAHSVFWNTRGIGSGAAHVVQSEQSRYGYVIGTQGSRTGVSLGTFGGSKCFPVDHVEGAGTGETLEPYSLYQDQVARRLTGPRASLGEPRILGFPTNSLILPLTVSMGGTNVNAADLDVHWRVVAADGTVLFSNVNSPAPQVTFSARGTNDLEATVSANGFSSSARIRVILLPAETERSASYSPEADAYVRDGAFADDNFGSEPTLHLKQHSTPGFNRCSFLNFRIPRTEYDRAVLELAARTAPPTEGLRLALHSVTNTWLEDSITWNNQPVIGDVLADWAAAENSLERIDVSASAQPDPEGFLAFRFGLLISSAPSDTVYSFASRESADLPGPRLELIWTNAAFSYLDWTNHLEGAGTPAENPDADAWTNAAEYLFGLNPFVPDPPSVLGLEATAMGLVLTYPQRRRWPPGSFYVIETASSLHAPWLPAEGVQFNLLEALDDTVRVAAIIPRADESQRFYRFSVILRFNNNQL
ncbi:MAG TPA: DNRLRE domain-containing protein [Verrucomicrobiae bacterium]|nr:DNRLRE domain-containing protein [Verrucomicrobiae bacterium]